MFRRCSTKRTEYSIGARAIEIEQAYRANQSLAELSGAALFYYDHLLQNGCGRRYRPFIPNTPSCPNEYRIIGFLGGRDR